jgi:hypothetical protein
MAARRRGRRGNYVERLASSPDALRGSFGSYRAIDENYAQNQQRNTRRLTLPVLAIGGGHWLAEHGRRSHHAGADLGGLIS